MPAFPPMNSPSVWYGELTPAQKVIVLKNVKTEGARLFAKYRSVLKEALGLEDLKGDALLQAYRQRTPDVWANLQQNFPDTYAEQMTQFGKLEQQNAQKIQLPPVDPSLSSPDAKSAPLVPTPQGT